VSRAAGGIEEPEMRDGIVLFQIVLLDPKTRREPSGERSGDSGRLMAHKSSAVMTRLAGSAAKPGMANSSSNKMANSQVR